MSTYCYFWCQCCAQDCGCIGGPVPQVHDRGCRLAYRKDCSTDNHKVRVLLKGATKNPEVLGWNWQYIFFPEEADEPEH